MFTFQKGEVSRRPQSVRGRFAVVLPRVGRKVVEAHILS